MLTVILCFVYFAGTVGLMAFFWALFVDLKREKAALDYSEQVCKAEVTADSLRKLSEKAEVKGTLWGKQLADLARSWGLAEAQQKTLPDGQELQRLRAGTLRARWAPVTLRLCSAGLLIVGICGTLWGVHEALGGSGSRILTKLPGALEPSRWAVLITVGLLVLQAIFESLAEKLLCRMDEFTLLRLLPQMQPPDRFERALTDFTSEIHGFADTMQSYVQSSQRMQQFSANMEAAAKKINDEWTDLDNILKEMVEDNQRMGKVQQELEGQMQQAVQDEGALRALVEVLEQVQPSLLAAAEKLSSPLETLVQTSEHLTKAVCALSDLATYAEPAVDVAQRVQDVPQMARRWIETVRESIRSLAVEGQMSERAQKRLEGHVYRFSSQVRQVESGSKSMTLAMSSVIASAEEMKKATAELTKQVPLQRDEMQRVMAVLESHAATLQQKSEALTQQLADAEAPSTETGDDSL